MDENIGIGQMMQGLGKAMDAQIDRLKKDLGTVRTGRASPQLLDNIRVDYYGSQVPLKQVGAVSVPDAKTLEIQPWDPSAISEIEKAIQKSDLGITPRNDGKVIRITMPTMTEDRRKTLARTIGKLSEEFKISIRNERRDAVEKVKKSLKVKEISEDDAKRFETDIQKMTDTYTKKVDDLVAEKSKEVMTV